MSDPTHSPSRLSRSFRQLRAWLLTLVAVLIIATAVLVGVGRALIPYADSMRPWLTERLSERLGEPVRIGRIEAHWPRLTPQLSLFDVRIGPDEVPLLQVNQARIEMHLPNLIDRDSNLMELIVLGLELALEEDEEGQWGIRVVGGGKIGLLGSDADARLIGDLAIQNARFTVRAQSGLELATRLSEGEIQRRGRETSIRGRMEPIAGGGKPLEFSLLLQADDNRWTGAQAWIGAESLQIAQWLSAPWIPADAEVSLQAWADLNESTGTRVDMDLVVDGIGRPGDRLKAEVLVSRQNRSTQVNLVSLERTGTRSLQLIKGLAVARQGEHWALALDSLELEPLHALVSPWLSDQVWWPSQLSGQLQSIEAGWQMTRGLSRLSGRLSALRWRLPDRFPSVSNLDLELGLSGDRPILTPRGQPRVDWASVFNEPIDIEMTQGRALLSWRAIELDDLLIDTGFLRGTSDGWLYFANRKPFMDLMIEVDRLGPLDPRRFMPQRFIPPKTREWLNRSLTQIDSASGYVLLSMQAGLKTPQIRRGHVVSEFEVEGADIAYQPDWPAALDLNGKATFVGREIYARVDGGRLGDLPLASAELAIPDLVDPVLDLSLDSGPSDAADVQSLLATIPQETWQRSLEPMQWSGEVAISAQMTLPIKRMPDWWLEGQAALADARLVLPDAGLQFDALNGQLSFDRQALGPSTLQLNLDRPQAQGDRIELLASFAESAWLELSGQLNPLSVVMDPGPLRGRLVGTSDFSVRVDQHPQGGLALRLNSDLTGLAIDLPAPLAKESAAAWPTRLEVRLNEPFQSVAVSIADVFELDVLELQSERDSTGWRVAVSADHQPTVLPNAGLRVRGELALLNLDDWRALLSDQVTDVSDDATDELQADIDLSVSELVVAGVRLEDVDFELGRDSTDWRARFDGPDVAGEVVVPIPLDSGRVVVADLERLRFDPIAPEEESADLVNAHLTSTENPLGRPPLHLLVEDLRWGELDLGRARLESHPSAEGIEVELIDVSGPDLRFNGGGRWIWRDGRPESQFSGRLTTSSVGPLLESSGYQSPLQAERTQLEVDLRWPGAPADFALGRLSGVLDLQIADGLIPEARPGAGRLLGLGSLAALPRRLALDFRDVFESGLKFDQIEGRFDLASGFARTDALTVYSPAVLITISGDTDMANRQYDQVVRVEPGLGGTLPVIGVLAGGPVGAAAGLVLQSILERPMRGLAEARYTVTGPWSEPQMELVEARVSEADPETSSTDNANPRSPD